MSEKSNVKEPLPLLWIVAGLSFLLFYLAVAIRVIFFVYFSHGAIAALSALIGISFAFRFVSPLIIRFLNSRKKNHSS